MSSEDGDVGADAGSGRGPEDQLQGSGATAARSGQPGEYYPFVSPLSDVVSSLLDVGTGMLLQGQVQKEDSKLCGGVL